MYDIALETPKLPSLAEKYLRLLSKTELEVVGSLLGFSEYYRISKLSKFLACYLVVVSCYICIHNSIIEQTEKEKERFWCFAPLDITVSIRLSVEPGRCLENLKKCQPYW